MLIFFAAPTSPAPQRRPRVHPRAGPPGRPRGDPAPSPAPVVQRGVRELISTRALARHYPAEAALQGQLDRLADASALHTRALIPWPDRDADPLQPGRRRGAGQPGVRPEHAVRRLPGQSARHSALARFLTLLGEGIGATQAFGTAFGLFGPESAAYEATLAALKDEFQPGLYVVQRLSADRRRAGRRRRPAETAVVELLIDGELVRRREVDFDGSGMLVASLPSTLLDGAGSVRLRGDGAAPRRPGASTRSPAPAPARAAPPTRAPASAPEPARARRLARAGPGAGSTGRRPVRPAARRLSAHPTRWPVTRPSRCRSR